MIRTRSYECKDILLAEVFSTRPKKFSLSKREKKNSTTQKMKRYNYHQKAWKLLRIILANFVSTSTSFLTLTIKDQEGLDNATLHSIWKNFINRLKTRAKSMGWGDLKYIKVVETGANDDNIHFHVVLNIPSSRQNREIIEDAWQHGNINLKQAKIDYESAVKLSYYLCKEDKPDSPETEIDDKGTLVPVTEKNRFFYWSRSRNTENPEAKVSDKGISDKQAGQLYNQYVKGKNCSEWENIFKEFKLIRVKASYNKEYNKHSFRIAMRRKKTRFDNNKEMFLRNACGFAEEFGKDNKAWGASSPTQ